MKIWLPMIILILAVAGLCVWDGINTNKTFSYLSSQVQEICTDIESENYDNLVTKLEDLDKYWTKKMDVLCISISKKDLQPVSDYIQYLYSSVLTGNTDDYLTYARLLSYNIKGLAEANGISLVNLL